MSSIRSSIETEQPRTFWTVLLGLVLSSVAYGNDVPVNPVVAKHCISCHGSDKPKSGLDFTNPETFLDVDVSVTLTNKKIVEAGKPENSYLIDTISNPDTETPMPPKGDRLTANEVQQITDWIRSMGAPNTLPRITGGNLETNFVIFLGTRCAECHGPAVARPKGGFRYNASDLELSFRDYIDPKNPEQSELILRLDPKLAGKHGIEIGRMPPSPATAASPEELALVYAWVAGQKSESARPNSSGRTDGTEQQGRIGTEYVLKSILDDVRHQSGASERVQHSRYFSLNHLLLTGITNEDLQKHRDAFFLTLNHLTTQGTLVKPKPIEPTRTVYRVDITELDWGNLPYDDKFTGNGPKKLDYYDLLLLEYPMGFTRRDLSSYQQLAREYIQEAELVRPIPYIHADWFVAKAVVPPLYDDFLQLPLNLSDLEKRLGINRKRNIDQFATLRAGRVVSGVSKHIRLVERHRGETAYYWLSHDFANSLKLNDAFMNPNHFKADGGEVVFGLPNGMQGFYIADAQGHRLPDAPTLIVLDPHEPDGIVRNGLSCIRCHDRGGLHPFRDEMAKQLQGMPPNPGFDKKAALQLYRGDEALQKELTQDRRVYSNAMKELFGDREVSPKEVLGLVTSRYLHQRLDWKTMAAELGYSSLEEGEKIRNVPRLQTLGATGAGLRRDAWEKNFADAIMALQLGEPILAIDGVTSLAIQPQGGPIITLDTREGTNRFRKGDHYHVRVTNHSQMPVHVEFIWRGPTGRMIVVENPKIKSIIEAGATYELPPIAMGSGFGKEDWIVLTSFEKLGKGRRFRLSDEERRVGYHIGDRYVHDGLLSGNQGDARMITRSTLQVECIP